MDERIEEITILGGGTAGWLAATYFITRLNQPAAGRPMRVTLIESPSIPTVGVGEATVPSMRELLRQLDINERDFIKACNASFKLGVRFQNWDVDGAGRPCSYDHPFDGLGVDLRGVNPAAHYHRFAAGEEAPSLGACLSPTTALIDALRGPKDPGDGDFDYQVGYAYHLDAALFAGFLQRVATERGVLHILDDLVDAVLDERGFVAALQLKERGARPVELVVDCTGFRSLLLQHQLGEGFESYAPYLLNDRALAVQLPHPEPERLEPCTRSTALGAGWSWRVPLYSRVGTGYVFSSAFRSDQEAMDEFLAHLGPAAQAAEPRVIPMRIGRARRSWVKNCVAIGLSAGFIEPLESTAIYLIEMAARSLVANFPDRSFAADKAAAFNARMQGLYEEVRDFIILHYRAANRDDSAYWRAVREDLQVPDALAANLEAWRHRLPQAADFDAAQLFGSWSYLIVLSGKRYLQPRGGDGLSAQDWLDFQQWFAGQRDGLLAGLPGHHALLTQIRAQASAGIAEDVPSFQQPITRLGAARATVPLPGQAIGAERMRLNIRWKAPRPAAAGNLL